MQSLYPSTIGEYDNFISLNLHGFCFKDIEKGYMWIALFLRNDSQHLQTCDEVPLTTKMNRQITQQCSFSGFLGDREVPGTGISLAARKSMGGMRRFWRRKSWSGGLKQ